jgi:hypothetical protein
VRSRDGSSWCCNGSGQLTRGVLSAGWGVIGGQIEAVLGARYRESMRRSPRRGSLVSERGEEATGLRARGEGMGAAFIGACALAGPAEICYTTADERWTMLRSPASPPPPRPRCARLGGRGQKQRRRRSMRLRTSTPPSAPLERPIARSRRNVFDSSPPDGSVQRCPNRPRSTRVGVGNHLTRCIIGRPPADNPENQYQGSAAAGRESQKRGDACSFQNASMLRRRLVTGALCKSRRTSSALVPFVQSLFIPAG